MSLKRICVRIEKLKCPKIPHCPMIPVMTLVRMIENGSFRIFLEKLGCFHRTSLFYQSLQLQLMYGTSAKALKKMSSLEIVASSSLMLCRSKNAENKRKSDLY